jgi:hypothetical protein
MKKYNIQDVRLTEELYDKLLPWIPNHPNVSLYDDRPDACPRCGANGTMEASGMRRTKTMQYRRYRCIECSSWCKGRMAEPTVRPDYV